MDVFISPLEVVDNTLISEFLFNDKKILEKFNHSFVDVEMIELSYHSLLIFQIFLIRIDESVPLIDYRSDVVESLSV